MQYDEQKDSQFFVTEFKSLHRYQIMSKPIHKTSLFFPCVVCGKGRKKMVRTKFEKRQANKAIRRENKKFGDVEPRG